MIIFVARHHKGKNVIEEMQIKLIEIMIALNVVSSMVLKDPYTNIWNLSIQIINKAGKSQLNIQVNNLKIQIVNHEFLKN